MEIFSTEWNFVWQKKFSIIDQQTKVIIYTNS